jgi:hypothetical protein
MFEGLTSSKERQFAIELSMKRAERAAELFQERDALLDIVRYHPDLVIAKYASRLAIEMSEQALELKKGLRL